MFDCRHHIFGAAELIFIDQESLIASVSYHCRAKVRELDHPGCFKVGLPEISQDKHKICKPFWKLGVT